MKVVVCGCGVLGSQISWQVALSGFEVNVYEIDEKALGRCKDFHTRYSNLFRTKKPFEKLFYYVNLEECLKDIDLVIESIPEDLRLKRDFLSKVSKIVSEDIIIATNSSTFRPSDLKGYIDNPSRFLALHFANPIWEANIAEIMGHSETDIGIFNKVVEFARDIGMEPIKIYKEQAGYVLNSMLIPWLESAQRLYFSGVANFEDIDKAWIISTKSKIGPFGVIDLVGLRTIYNIVLNRAKETNNKEMFKRAKKIKEEFLDKDKLGVETGEGFYKYPNPNYEKYVK